MSGPEASAAIEGNTISNNLTGIDIEGGSATVTGNTITGTGTTGTGLNLGSGATLVSATGNIITGNSTGIDIASGATSVGRIFDNDLAGNTTALNNGSALTINASANWWGSSTEAGVAASIISLATDGIIDVDYTPWFDDGNNSVFSGPGFQGDFSNLDVGFGGAELQSGGRINEAIGLLTSGGTIKVYDGSYAENVNVTEALTLEAVDGAAPRPSMARSMCRLAVSRSVEPTRASRSPEP